MIVRQPCQEEVEFYQRNGDEASILSNSAKSAAAATSRNYSSGSSIPDTCSERKGVSHQGREDTDDLAFLPYTHPDVASRMCIRWGQVVVYVIPPLPEEDTVARELEDAKRKAIEQRRLRARNSSMCRRIQVCGL